MHTVNAFVCLSQVVSAARWDRECVWTVLVEASPQIRAVLTITPLWAGLQRGTMQWMCLCILSRQPLYQISRERLTSQPSWNWSLASIVSGESFSGRPDGDLAGPVWHWGLCGSGGTSTGGSDNFGGQSSGQNLLNLKSGLVCKAVHWIYIVGLTITICSTGWVKPVVSPDHCISTYLYNPIHYRSN